MDQFHQASRSEDVSFAIRKAPANTEWYRYMKRKFGLRGTKSLNDDHAVLLKRDRQLNRSSSKLFVPGLLLGNEDPQLYPQ